MEQYSWFKSYDPGMPHTLEPYEPKTLLDCFDEALKARPEAAMLIFKDRRVSYREIESLSNALAEGLTAAGVRKGDRVALIVPNCPQVVFCHFGIWKAGAIAAPINPLYTGAELERSLNECGASVVICLSTFYKTVKKIQPQTKVRLVVVTGIQEFLPPLAKVAFMLFLEKKGGHRVKVQKGDLCLQDILHNHRGAARPESRIKPEDVAILLFSGGTTGTTEAAVGTHHALYMAGHQLRTWFSSLLCEWDDIILATIPTFHVFGNVALMGTAIVNHNPLALIPNPRDINDLVATIKKLKPAFIPGVPTLFVALLNHPAVKSGKVSFKCAKLCVSGGAPLLAELKHRFESLTGGRMVEGYALTESMLACVATPVKGRFKEGAVGLPLPDVILKVVDAETGTKEMPAGEPGEIIMKAPEIMQCYWQRPAETAGMIRDGWLYTGDIGYLDEDGYLYIQSRKKLMIKCGGFQVWPRQVEEVLGSHKAVVDVIVAGVPDPYQGEMVKAWVVLDGLPCTVEELRAYCKERLTAYKVPRQIEIRQSLPKSAIGKPLARILLDEELAKKQQ
ncbi:MAG: AMP-binding protein [Dehalococcoidia bacterium]